MKKSQDKLPFFRWLKENKDFFDKKFRIKQLYNNIFSSMIYDFNEMTDLPVSLRERLLLLADVIVIKEVSRIVSKDETVKFLFELKDGNKIESVVLKDKNDRYTFCISTQCGCRMGCVFCRTGSMGLIRNLSYDEIISQVLFLSRYIYTESDERTKEQRFNIVFMGMGEPLDNYDNLVSAVEILLDKDKFGLSPSRITLSTCGILDKLLDFSKIFPEINIALSLNASSQEKREIIMPVSKKFSFDQLVSVCKDIALKNSKRITFEYVLVDSENNLEDDIQNLIRILDKNFLLNIIPLNDTDTIKGKISEDKIMSFINRLTDAKCNVTRRYRKGEDIMAACGQLSCKENDDNFNHLL